MTTFFFLIVVWISYALSQDTELIPGVKQHTDVITNCEDGWYYFSEKCYLLAGKENEKRLPWDDAKWECSKYGAHLASIHTRKEQEFLANFLVLNAAFFTWIGLRMPEGGNERAWDDESPINFTAWAKGEPSMIYEGRKEDCVEIIFRRGGETGKWNDEDCTRPRAYICKKDTDPSLSGYNMKYCSPDVRGGYNFHESCYHIVTTPKSWQEAETFCQDTFSGHLVSVQDFAVHEFMTYIQRKNRYTVNTWIGLKATVENGRKTWSSDWPFTFNAWKDTATQKKLINDTCVILTTSANWDVKPCVEKYPFMCEYTLRSPPTFAPSTVFGSYCPTQYDVWHDLGGDFCYLVTYLVPSHQNYYRANHYCNQRGGSLASVHSKEVLDMLEPFVRYLDWIYMGLLREIDGHFSWIDKTDFNFKFWDVGEPDNLWEHCTALEVETMTLHDIPCEDKRPFLCSIQKMPPNVTTIEEEIVCAGELFQIVP